MQQIWSTIQNGSAANGTSDNAFEFLAAGETLELTYTVKTTDSSGATTGELTTDTSTVTVTITGTNDSPDFTIISGGDSGAVTEDASTTASGNATAQVNTLTLSGTYETGDIVTATVNNVDVPYTVTANDADLSDIATNLAAAINSDPNLVDSITANASGDALSISSDTPGVPFTLTTSTTDGGSDNTQTSATAPNTLNASGELLTDSGSISYDDLDLTDTLVTRSFVSAQPPLAHLSLLHSMPHSRTSTTPSPSPVQASMAGRLITPAPSTGPSPLTTP